MAGTPSPISSGAPTTFTMQDGRVVEVCIERDLSEMKTRLHAVCGQMHMIDEIAEHRAMAMTATEVQARMHAMAQKMLNSLDSGSSVLQDLRAKRAQYMHRQIEPTTCYLGRGSYRRMMAEMGGPASYVHQELHLNKTLLGMSLVIIENVEEHIGVAI